MKDQSLERTMREIASLSAPSPSLDAAGERLKLCEIHAYAKTWLRLAEAAKRDTLIDRWKTLHKEAGNG